MPVGFGFGVGDVIAVAKLVHRIVVALQEARGSSSRYLAIIADLRCLETSLVEVKAILPHVSVAQKIVLEEWLDDCRRTADEFLTRLDKYHGFLNKAGTGQAWKDNLKKIQWHFGTPADIRSFKDKISTMMDAIQTILSTIQISKLGLVETAIQETGNQSCTDIARLQHTIGSTTQFLEDMKSTLAEQVKEGVISTAAIGKMLTLICSNTNQLMLAVSASQRAIPPQVTLQHPVILVDALNRRSPIHLDWIDCKEAFLSVLELRFKGIGESKIRRNEFALSLHGMKTDVDTSMPWNRWFCPGQQVNMDMMFEKHGTTENDSLSCPSCKAECPQNAEEEIECPSCHTFFRRSIDVAKGWFAAIDDVRIESLDENTNVNNATPEPARPEPIRSASDNSDRRGKRRPDEDLEDNVRKYRRIRIRHSRRSLVGENQIQDWYNEFATVVTCPRINRPGRYPPIDLEAIASEFRSAGILACYDRSTEQVFTFYCKSEIKNPSDQKGILSTLRRVLFDNYMTVAFRTAQRFTDLAQPQNKHLRQTFYDAVQAGTSEMSWLSVNSLKEDGRQESL